MDLKFYTRVAKRLKVKPKKFSGLIHTFLKVTGEKLVGGGGHFAPLPSPIGLILSYVDIDLLELKTAMGQKNSK